jgi:hypothetical protein
LIIFPVFLLDLFFYADYASHVHGPEGALVLCARGRRSSSRGRGPQLRPRASPRTRPLSRPLGPHLFLVLAAELGARAARLARRRQGEPR